MRRAKPSAATLTGAKRCARPAPHPARRSRQPRQPQPRQPTRRRCPPTPFRTPPASRVFCCPPARDSLDAIAKEVATCKLCPLYATATNPVPGEGNPNADLMCVGEAPGATEDETGRPFVGAAGQLLTKILAAIDLPREEVFICNVLKHRPPGNRNPAPDEVTACSPYLVRQIEIVQAESDHRAGARSPRKRCLTRSSRSASCVARFTSITVFRLIVTYHPAALLRNPAWKRPTWEDVQLARRILDSSSAGA